MTIRGFLIGLATLTLAGFCIGWIIGVAVAVVRFIVGVMA